MKKLCVFMLLALVILSSLSVLAHGGRLDSSGGHNKKADGTYHYHSGDDRTTEYKTKPSSDTTTNTTNNKTTTNVTNVTIVKPTPAPTPQQKLSVNLNGNPIKATCPSIVKDNVIYVPMEDICKALDASYTYVDKDKTATASLNKYSFTVLSNSIKAKANSKDVDLEAKAYIENDILMIPVNTFKYYLGVTVIYNEKGRIVDLYYDN